MLRDSVLVVGGGGVGVVVVRTRPRTIPLAMLTMRKSTHGFPFVFHIWVAYGAPLGGPSAGAPLLNKSVYKVSLLQCVVLKHTVIFKRHFK